MALFLEKWISDFAGSNKPTNLPHWKSPSILSKEDLRGVRKIIFHFSEKSEACPNSNGILCAESNRLNRCFGCLKNTPHSLKGDFGGVMHKNFSFSEKSAHYSKINRCICLCGRCVSASTQCGYWLFCVLEKYPLIPLREKSRGVPGKTFLHLEESPFYPNGRRCVCAGRRWLWKIKSGMKRTQKAPLIPSKEDLGRGVGKIFLWFIKICALPKPTQALLCRRTGPYIADNKTGTSPFVWRCPLSLFNAAQFLRWVYL